MLLSAFTLALCANLALAQVEDGNWQEQYYNYDVQQCEGAYVNGMDFTLPDGPNGDSSGGGECSNGHLRAEFRYQNDYSSGIHQFQGYFTINDGSGSKIALKQTFNDGTGPYFIMAIDNLDDGNLYSVEGGDSIAQGVAYVNNTVQINTVHDVDGSRYSVYVNGQEQYTDNNPPSGNFYDKIGAYTTDSGSGPIDVTWSGVQFWTQ